MNQPLTLNQITFLLDGSKPEDRTQFLRAMIGLLSTATDSEKRQMRELLGFATLPEPPMDLPPVWPGYRAPISGHGRQW